jgi:aldose sugar dehydrogenase
LSAAGQRVAPPGAHPKLRAMRHLLLTTLLFFAAPAAAQERAASAAFRVSDFATGLERPWGGAFLPDGRLLVTERPGRMRLVGRDGRVSAPLAGVPQVETGGQGGLLDVALAPDFARTREVYFCHSVLLAEGAATRLVRARLAPGDAGLEAATPILDATPAQRSGRNHYGCRIAFGPDGALFLSTGDRYETKMRAQRLDDLAGKVLRVSRDGAPLADNPFVRQAGARPEIWTLGHRNPQGLAFNPRTGSLWEGEFGARGGDEVNVLRPGRNYGWPVVAHGTDYDGSRIGEGTSRPGMEDPIHVWVPSVSPSGIAFYTGDAFPGWRGSLFLAALNPPGLVRLSTDGDRVTGEERLLWRGTRLRDVAQGPEGFLYVLTDEPRGRVLRLEPG